MQSVAHGLNGGAAQLAAAFHQLRLVDREDLRNVYHAFLGKVGLASLQKHIAGRLLTRVAP
jgi:hypothetical protein